MNNKVRENFWHLPLDELTKPEWEALCDSCAKCCLFKLEDEETSEVYYTRAVCKYIDLDRCRCSDYKNRHSNMPECIAFSANDVLKMTWLPKTCAYLLRAKDLPLFDWHHLISGDYKKMRDEKKDIATFATIVSDDEDLEDYIIELDHE